MSQKRTNILFKILIIVSLLGSVISIWRSKDYGINRDIALLQRQLSGIVTRASLSVVAVETKHQTVIRGLKSSNSGSGFIIDADGHIITNEHVIHDADQIYITLSDQRKYIAEVTGVDIRNDIAVLKIEAENLTALPIAHYNSVAIGHVVVALGNPLGTGADGKAVATFGRVVRMNQKLSSGIDTKNDRFYDNLVQTDAVTMPGNSGGPLINEYGQVVGINTALGYGSQTNQQFGFAIHLDARTLEIIGQLKQGRKVTHAFLGLDLSDQIDDETRKKMGLKDISGAMVETVLIGFSAHKSDIRSGDIIRVVDGKRIHSRHELISYMNQCRPRQQIQITLLRNATPAAKSNTIEVSVELGERNPSDLRGIQQEAGSKNISVWGMKLIDLTTWRKSYMDLKTNQRGVLVYGVQTDSPAQQQQVKLGTIIVGIGSIKIHSLKDVVQAVRQYGDKIPAIERLQTQPILDL